MSYLIILFVIALALAPIMALKPSKRQKQQVAMRDRARTCGLQVQVCQLPQTHRQQVRQEDSESGVAYRLLWRHPLAKFKAIHFLLLREEKEPNKAPVAIVDALQETLAALPASVMAVEFTDIGLAAFWQEEGEPGQVEQIAAQLQSLRERLQPLSW